METNQIQRNAAGNNAASIQEKPIDILKGYISAPSVQAQFMNALGDHKDAFVASLIDLFTGDKYLQNCKPSLIIAEALRAATLRLPLNKALGFAYIIVFNNKELVRIKDENGTEREVYKKVPTPTFVPGYKGYIQLAMRTAQYRTINADVVYEGEVRNVNKLTGEIAFDGERKSDKIVGYFCYFELLNGFSKTLYMTLEDMAAYAKRYSPSINNATTVKQLIALANSGVFSKKIGWEGNFNDMALKTVIRNLLSKYGYLSVEMENAVSKDIASDSTVERDVIIESANKQDININDVEFTEIDTSTGEIKEHKPIVADGPDY